MHILLVEDDAVDARAVQRAFRKRGVVHPLVVASDGIHALAILRGREGQPRLLRPFLILLDLNLPRMDGHAFLAELRADPNLRDSVVFVLTTSTFDEDIQRAYQQQVAGYLVKSRLGESQEHLVALIECYGLIVKLPGSSDG